MQAGDARQKETQVNLLILCLMAVAVGLITGFGAVLFRGLVAVIHNLFFLGELSFFHDANEFTPAGPWGPFIILAPILGGLVVVWMVKTFAPEAKGHGVPEVLDAVYHQGGTIRPVVAAVKILASGLSIGSGASVGREGPIIQIGSALGSTFGQLSRLIAWQKITLLAAGAGAGIAATFNTPLGAVLFAVELILPEISTRTFLPVVLATGTATYIGRIFLGIEPAFSVPLASAPSLVPLEPTKLAAFIVLGLLCGLTSWAFIKLLPWMEEKFEKAPGGIYVKNVVGMGLVGLIFYLLQQSFGHYYVEGVSYGAIQAVLTGELTDMHLLALLFVAKLAATTLSLAAGASGGIFSPSLFLGTTIGGAFGAALAVFMPELSISIPEFAMVGMAGVVGGSTGAALMAITMIFEMTRDYNIIVPLIVAVAIATGVRRALFQETIYSIKLLKRGRKIPVDHHTNMYLVHHAREIMDANLSVFEAETLTSQAVHQLKGQAAGSHVLIRRGNRIGGVATVGAILRHANDPEGVATLGELATRNFILVREDDILHDVFLRINRHRAQSVALVFRGEGVPRIGHVIGVISKAQISDAVLANYRA